MFIIRRRFLLLVSLAMMLETIFALPITTSTDSIVAIASSEQEDPVLMTLAPRKKPVAIFTRAPTMELWLPEVVPDIVEEAPPVAPAPPPPAPPPPAPPPAAPLLELATKPPTEQLLIPTRKTGWVKDPSLNLGPAPEDTTATPPVLALATKPPTEQLLIPTRKMGWNDDSSLNLGPAPEDTTATPPATALPSVAAWASSSMEAEQAAKVEEQLKRLASEAEAQKKAEAEQAAKIEAEIAREAAAAESKKPTGSPTGSLGTKAKPAENDSKTPAAPVVNSDSKSLSTVTDTPADNVKRSSQVEIAAVAAIASVIAMVIIGIAVATFRARKLRKGDETKALVESLLAPNMRDAVPHGQPTPILH